jgi:hypothetical protein
MLSIKSATSSGVLVMSSGRPGIDPRPPADLQIAALADRFVHAIGDHSGKETENECDQQNL